MLGFKSHSNLSLTYLEFDIASHNFKAASAMSDCCGDLNLFGLDIEYRLHSLSLSILLGDHSQVVLSAHADIEWSAKTFNLGFLLILVLLLLCNCIMHLGAIYWSNIFGGAA